MFILTFHCDKLVPKLKTKCEEIYPYKDNDREMYEVDGKVIPIGWKFED